MAKSALTQLQEQIEAIRREAYAAGYAAAMQVIQKAAGGGPAAPAVARRGRPPTVKAAQPTAAISAEAVAPAPAERAASRPARATGRRRLGATAATRSGAGPRRGNNAALISEILKAIAPRAARPAEIRTALQRDKGLSVAFTSIRHALGQLEARQVIEQVGDSKTWRLKA